MPVGTGRHVVALLLDTGRAPYVVNIPNGGRITREVPWRANNSTRTAHRRELLATVVPQARVPELELVRGVLRVSEVEPYSGTGRDDDLTYEVTVDATVLAVATLPSARRRGVGGALTAFLAQHAIANGVDQVLLSAQDEDVARA